MDACKEIFILSGQSNMAGRGGVVGNKWDGVIPPECAPDDLRILRLNAQLRWEPARDPLHADIDVKKTCGVGPGMAFANAVKDRVGTVGLVPCAVGGTRIGEWARGGILYDDMIKRAKAARIDGGGEIRAMLWYQGESDASAELVDLYKANLEAVFRNLRADLSSPSLPIIQVAIVSGGEQQFVDKIRQIQREIDLPNSVCVDAAGLQLKGDNLHLTTEAQVQLGRLLADAYLNHFSCGP
ncbi:hypothetical protein M569_11363 [Genlisea aurea]|uniref:Sialate O-acetylesterase domain-containing protein n=1 Tax=Genlisea aurea TaxID=192259 RepID=S8DU79_9LAMI|nr:hypothetical protein M569_11363 [Genlisea aurea]